MIELALDRQCLHRLLARSGRSVGAYALSMMPGRYSFTTASQRASRATLVFGWLGALGAVIGITALLWRLVPGAALALIGCSLVALVVLTVVTRLAASLPPHPVRSA